LLNAYNTPHSARISSDYANNYFEYRFLQILLTSECGRRSNLSQKLCKTVAEKME